MMSRRKYLWPLVVFTVLVGAATFGFSGQSSSTGEIPEDTVWVEDAPRPALGSDDAPAVMVVFTDYQCPFCMKFFEERLPALKEKFVDSGDLRVVVRDMPLARHRFARPAAVAAACADNQGAYWPMHEALYARQAILPDVDLTELAGALDLDRRRFDACMSDEAASRQIDEDLESARGAKISGTPAFLIGVPRDGRIYGRVIVGYQPLSVYQTEIRDALEPETSP
jgi:protein-disulfide isomerase